MTGNISNNNLPAVSIEEEIAVINDELIIQSVLKEDEQEVNAPAINDHTKEVHFASLNYLSLSFKNLFKIDNLYTLQELHTLKLDNNIIHTIEGIDHLIHLKVLDLSFNNLTKITGLEHLTNLQDLILYGNSIETIENLDHLHHLEIFSIGKNQLQQMDNILYLRPMKNLKALNLDGNPLCKDPDYTMYVLAHLDQLKYLDSARIEQSDLIKAREQYQDSLEEYKEIKAIEDVAKSHEEEHLKYTEELRKANLLIIENLFDDMFKDDNEMPKIKPLPGLQSLIDDYADKIKSVTEEVKPKLFKNSTDIYHDKDLFEEAFKSIVSNSKKRSIEKCDAYAHTTKKLLKRAEMAPPDEMEKLLSEAYANNEALYADLMEIETEVVDDSEQLVDQLEEKIEKLGEEGRVIATEHFRSVEDMENAFYESVTQLAANLMERASAEEGEDDDLLGEECRAILNDRDTLNNAINGSHDIHVGKLLSQEEAMNKQGIDLVTSSIKIIRDIQWKRNRERITEILNIKEKNAADIDSLGEELINNDEEED